MHESLSLLLGALAGLAAAAAFAVPKLRRSALALKEREAELARLRAEHRSVSAELEALRLAAAEPRPDIAADNAELRRRMDELADALMTRDGRG